MPQLLFIRFLQPVRPGGLRAVIAESGVHVSQAGGLTPARKIAILAEAHGVRAAWHGPADVSPVGHGANLTLSVTAYNFGN